MMFTEEQVRTALKAYGIVQLVEDGIIDTLKEVHGHQEDDPQCPKCGGRMWDNRMSKRNPRAPDFKCRDRSCDGVIWPPR